MDGNQGQLGLALVPTGGPDPTAPTVTLRVQQFADPMPTFIETTDEVATGTRFGSQKFIQGVQSGNKTIQARATARDLIPLLTALLAAPDVAGLITPRPGSFAALAPGQPLKVWQKHPLKDAVFPNAQIGGITITIPNRQNVDMSVTLNTGVVEAMGTPPTFPPLVNTGIFQMLHFFVKIGTVEIAPESGSIEITQGMSVEDGARGLQDANKMYPIGWSMDGSLTAKLSFVISESGAGISTQTLAALMALATPDTSTGVRTTQTVEAGFKIGADTYKFTFPTAALIATNIPTGLGKITVGFDAESQAIGTPPVTVNVPVIP